MTGRGRGEDAAAAGGPSRHRPVLLAEVLHALAALDGGRLVDATFGAGGYSAALLDAHPATTIVAIDRDPSIIAAGREMADASGGRLRLVQGRFGTLDAIAHEAGAVPVDGVVLDIGVSSMQLDEAARGFSFRSDGPLDMRMEQAGPSAADLVNGASEGELADLLYLYGEERRSRVIARAIVERRRRQAFETTADLAALVARHVRAEPGHDPATRTFQALRIAVNDELGELVAALHAAERILAPGGRLAVVTFHSLEDRIVKRFLQARSGRSPAGSRHLPTAEPAVATFRASRGGPVVPGEAELRANPRSRSAKLRVAVRTEAPASAPLADLFTSPDKDARR